MINDSLVTKVTAETTAYGHKCIVVHHYYPNIPENERRRPSDNWYCGYLQVPKGIVGLTEEILDENLPSALGGITYEADSLPDCLPDDGNSYVGFDTCHWGMQRANTKTCLNALKRMAQELDEWAERMNTNTDELDFIRLNSYQFQLSQEIFGKRISLNLSRSEAAKLASLSLSNYTKIEQGIDFDSDESQYQQVLDKLKRRCEWS